VAARPPQRSTGGWGLSNYQPLIDIQAENYGKQSIENILFYCSNSLDAEELSQCRDELKDHQLTIIGLPCSGKLNVPYLVKAFETGADGVVIVTCETCSARCPMGIEVAAVMDALRILALEKKAAKQEGNVPLFNRAVLSTVRLFGRTYDIAMIAAYKIGTLKLMNDTEKFPTMLKKRKIALLPPTGADRKTTRRIFKKVKQNKADKK
jgi:hypothetical protein